MMRQEREDSGVPTPFELSAMRSRLGAEPGKLITKAEAADYYLDYPSKGGDMWLKRGLNDDQVREFVLNRLFDDLRRQLPAIAFTLNHLYRGAFHGLLTSRGARDTSHRILLETISELFGFAPHTDLTYFVNDCSKSKRLGAYGSDVKKAIVLTNFANGLKEDEAGFFVPMTVRKRFNEILFIEDEEKNLMAVMHCHVRAVYSRVLDAIGVTNRTPALETALGVRALKLTEEVFAKEGVAPTHSMNFWVSVVDELLFNYTRSTGKHKDREELIASLIRSKLWMPNIIKVYDGRRLDVESSIQGLKEVFAQRSPVVMGTRDSVIFNDIDRTILSVNAMFPIWQTGNPDPVCTFTQAEFAEHPNEAHWLQKVSEEKGIALKDLTFGWDHFRDENRIRMDILEALYKGQIVQNPHGAQ
jgi:hypothetical protein